MDWSGGYVADINYSGHYYAELNPARLSLALLNSGYELPKIEAACELGFGQGISVNIHAAAQPGVQWFGTDFLPGQAQFAQGLANITGSKAFLKDESFAEFCSREDLPDFDYICLHGIWTWISKENRDIIVDFLRRKLKPGGIAYISYNVMPGWAPATPMRHLLQMHANQMSAPALDSSTRAASALEFLDRFMGVKPAYASVNPGVQSRVDRLKTMEGAYLAHEYLNGSWNPMYFNEIADVLSDAKLSFACSATYSDLLDEIVLTPDQKVFLTDLPNEALYQTLRDFMVNQQFRRDIWIKGGVSLPPVQAIERIREQRVLLTSAAGEIPMEVELSGRKVGLQPDIYQPLIALMADNRPQLIGHLMDQMEAKGVQSLQVVQALIVLIGANHAAPAQDPVQAKAAEAMVRRYNAELLHRARYHDEPSTLASIHVAGGLSLDSVTVQMLALISSGLKTAPEIVDRVWASMAARNRVLMRDGQAINDKAENLAELTRRAEAVLSEQKPRLERAGVILDFNTKYKKT